MRLKVASMTVLAALVAVSCSKARTSAGGSGTQTSSEEAKGDEDGLQKVAGNPQNPQSPSGPKLNPEAPSKARVRNFEQYLYSMEAITGIKASDTTVVPSGTTPAVNHTVNSVYLNNKDNLPGSHRVAETAPVNVKAYADVAAIFGRRLFLGTDAAAVAARAAFLGSEPTTGPDQYFTDQVLADLIKKAWGGNVDAANMPTYVSILKGLLTDLKSNLPPAEQSSADGTKKLLVAALGVLAASDMVL